VPVAERARVLIDDAAGLNVEIMVRTRVSADAAFQVLVEMSQHSNTIVRVVAQQMIDSLPQSERG
jgi:hypothetical protein